MLEATSVCWRDRIRCVLRSEQWARHNGLPVGWAASAREMSRWLVIHPPKGSRRQPSNGGKLLTCVMLQLQWSPLDGMVLDGVAVGFDVERNDNNLVPFSTFFTFVRCRGSIR